MKKKIFVGGLLILVLSIFSMVNLNKKENVLYEEKVNHDKNFAIMVQNGNQYEEYQSEDNKFPGDDYIFKKSECYDNNHTLVKDAISFVSDVNSITVKTNKTLYCYLYFDKSNIGILREKDPENHLTKELIGDIYRYQGLKNENVNNYICLGDYCCNTEECGADSNDKMYRIIGITSKGELRVIKRTALTVPYMWHTSRLTDTKWPDSDLFHQLNDYEDGTYKDNSFYALLDDKLKNIIIKKDWLYGDCDDINGGVYNAKNVLLIESGKLKTTHTVKNNDGIINEEYTWDVDKDKVNAYVGILYMHDYVNAYPNGMGRRDNVVNSWIHILNNESKHPSEHQELGQESWEFLITRYGYGYKSQNQYSIRYIHSNGAIYEVIPDFRCVVRPVFNINADIKLTGDGTLEKPFTITS